MPLRRSDYDQAARYLQRAVELIGDAPQTQGLRGIIDLAIRRLSPGDSFVGDAAAEIGVLGTIAAKVTLPDARTEILKAVAVLRDRS